jgi:hypothetical protein
VTFSLPVTSAAQLRKPAIRLHLLERRSAEMRMFPRGGESADIGEQLRIPDKLQERPEGEVGMSRGPDIHLLRITEA